MRELGTVTLVQIQTASLKAGQKPNRYYDPAPLRPVERLLAMEQGVIGITAEGLNIVDVHNTLHIASRNRVGNGISLGFTAHYDQMRQRFGDHLPDGIAGENIILATPETVLLDFVGRMVMLRSIADGAETRLKIVGPMAPCNEFSRYCLRQDAPLESDALKAALQFLSDGRRGHVLSIEDDTDRVIIAPGDRLFLVD